MAEIDVEKLNKALHGLLRYCVELESRACLTDGGLSHSALSVSESKAYSLIDEALPSEEPPEEPLKHDWREYRSDDLGIGKLRGFLCARCSKRVYWPEKAFPEDFRETDRRDKRTCRAVEWIDKSPLKEASG